MAKAKNALVVVESPTKAKTVGSSPKKFRRLAWLSRKKVEKKNQPVTSRKIAITM